MLSPLFLSSLVPGLDLFACAMVQCKSCGVSLDAGDTHTLCIFHRKCNRNSPCPLDEAGDNKYWEKIESIRAALTASSMEKKKLGKTTKGRKDGKMGKKEQGGKSKGLVGLGLAPSPHSKNVGGGGPDRSDTQIYTSTMVKVSTPSSSIGFKNTGPPEGVVTPSDSRPLSRSSMGTLVSADNSGNNSVTPVVATGSSTPLTTSFGRVDESTLIDNGSCIINVAPPVSQPQSTTITPDESIPVLGNNVFDSMAIINVQPTHTDTYGGLGVELPAETANIHPPPVPVATIGGRGPGHLWIPGGSAVCRPVGTPRCPHSVVVLHLMYWIVVK